MFDTLTRFILSVAAGALIYMLSAVGALSVWRVGTEVEPSSIEKSALHLAALILGAAFGYGMTHAWAFGSSCTHRQALPRFIGAFMLCAVAHEVAFYLLLAMMPWPYIALLACTLTGVLALGFMLAKAWVFRA